MNRHDKQTLTLFGTMSPYLVTNWTSWKVSKRWITSQRCVESPKRISLPWVWKRWRTSIQLILVSFQRHGSYLTSYRSLGQTFRKKRNSTEIRSWLSNQVKHAKAKVSSSSMILTNWRSYWIWITYQKRMRNMRNYLISLMLFSVMYQIRTCSMASNLTYGFMWSLHHASLWLYSGIKRV